MMQKIANAVMTPLLRSPLHGLVSRSLMLITVTGRKSGKVYTFPVQYTRDGENIVLFTQKQRVWWKNLQDNALFTALIQGQEITAHVTEFIHDEATIRTEMQRLFPTAPEKRFELASNLILLRVTSASP